MPFEELWLWPVAAVSYSHYHCHRHTIVYIAVNVKKSIIEVVLFIEINGNL
jgi:uncharacterized protein YjlB